MSLPFLKAAALAAAMATAPLCLNALSPARTEAQLRLSTGTPAIDRYDGLHTEWQRELPLAVIVAIENDNLFLGAYSTTGLDGSDTGRTHASLLQLSHVFEDGVSATLHMGTTLFTQRDGTSVDPAPRPQFFNEENSFRLVVDSILRGEGLYWTAGAGVTVLNGETLTIGGSGQQDAYHRVTREIHPRQWVYEYRPDGHGIRVGVTAEGGVGARGTLIQDAYARLSLQGEVTGRLSTIWEGSAIHSAVALTLHLARRDPVGNPILRLDAIQEMNQYFSAPSPELITRLRAALEGDWGQFYGELAFYEGDSVVRYHLYNFNNTTMTLGLAVRAQ